MKEENDSQLTHIVSHFASPVYGVAEKLRENGYDVAGRLGVRYTGQNQLPPDMVGILENRRPSQVSLFGKKFDVRKRRAFYLGTIWFDNAERGAEEDKKWVLEIHGKKDMKELTNVVENIASDYNVEVQPILYRKVPSREKYIDELHQ